MLEDKYCSRWLADNLTVDNICHMFEILKADNHFTHDEIVARLSPVYVDGQPYTQSFTTCYSYNNSAVGWYLIF